MNSDNKIVYLIFIILFSLIWFYFSEPFSKYREIRQCESYREKQVIGIIDSTYRTMRGAYAIKINGQVLTSYSLYLSLPRIDIYFEEGDSIYKPSGEFKYYIYKRANIDSLIVLESEINCKERVENIYNR